MDTQTAAFSAGQVFASTRGQCSIGHYPPVGSPHICLDWVRGFAAWIADNDLPPREFSSMAEEFQACGLDPLALSAVIGHALYLSSAECLGPQFIWPAIPVLPPDASAK